MGTMMVLVMLLLLHCSIRVVSCSLQYDVYVNEPKPLKEGEGKHIISVFVADEAGLINRVAGVFARRSEYTNVHHTKSTAGSIHHDLCERSSMINA